METTTTSCKFGNDCLTKKCENYTICSLLNTEKHITSLENRISELFSSLNSILQFSSNTGKEIISIKENSVTRDEIERQFKLIQSDISNFKKLILEKEEQILKVLNENSGILSELAEKIVNLEKSILN